MQKLSRLCRKRIQRTLGEDSVERLLVDAHLKDWQVQKQKLSIKSDFDLIRASVVLQGVSNKIKIEQAYIKFMDEVENYWKVLDYEERIRIIGFDLQEMYAILPSFAWNDKRIIIPFFGERMNDIYLFESVLFDLKQYHRLFHSYQELLEPVEEYRQLPYNGLFVPTLFVAERDADVVYFHPSLQQFFCVLKGEELVFPLFDEKATPFVVSDEQRMALAERLLDGDALGWLTLAGEYGVYSDAFLEQLMRLYKKKSWLRSC